MAEMINLAEHGVTPQSLFDYDVRVNQYTYPLEAYFRKRTVPGKYYDFTQNENTQVMMARYHPLNAPTDLISREKVNINRAGLAYTKQEILLDEDDILTLANPRNSAEYDYALRNIYDDATRPMIGNREKMEAQRAEVLFTGGLKVNENGYVYEFDFGIPEENKKTLKWYTGASEKNFNIINDISDIQDMLMNNGQNVPARYVLCPPKLLHTMLLDPTIRAELATLNPQARITRDELNSWMTSHELPILVPYSRKVTVPDETLSVGTQKRLLDENKCVFIPDGYVGDFVTGITPEEVNTDSIVQTASNNGITIQQWRSHDPEGQAIKASSRFFSTLSVPKQVVIGTIE